MPARYREVLSHGVFTRLLVGLAVSNLGDGMSMVAIAWLAIRLAAPQDRGLFVGAALAAATLPGVVAGLTLGRVFRRWDTRRLLLVNCLLRAGALGCIPILASLGALSPVLYIVVLAISSLMHAWAAAAIYSVGAELLPPENRMTGNALISTADFTMLIVGPALAGAITAVTSAATVIGIDAASYVFLGGILMVLRRSWPSAAAANESADVGGGWQALKRLPLVLALLVISFLFSFFYGPVETALPIYVVQVLGEGAQTLGWYWAVFGAGAVAGGLGAGLIGRAVEPLLVAIIAGWALTLLPLGLMQEFAPTAASFALGGVIYGPYTAMVTTLVQHASPPQMLTQINAFRGSIQITAAPLGIAVGGPMVAALGSQGTILAVAFASLGLAIVTGAVFTRWRDSGFS